MKNRNIKNFIALFFVICFALSMSASAWAHPSADTRVVRVGFYKWEGMNELNDDKKSGYAYEYLTHLARYNNWEYEFVGYDKTWSESLEMLENGDIDLLCSMLKTPEREGVFGISDLPMGAKSYTLSVLRDNEKYYLNDVENLNGLRIGVFKDNASNDIFAEFAKENNIEYEYVTSDNRDEEEGLMSMLESGEIDAIFNTEFRITDKEKIILTTSSVPFYIATNKNDTVLFDELNASMLELESNEPILQYSLREKYFTAYRLLGAPNITRVESEYIKSMEQNSVRIGFIEENIPFAWFEDGEYKGLYINILKAISDNTGLTIEPVPIKIEDYKCGHIVENKYDLDGFIGYPNDINKAEKNGFEISDPVESYYFANVYYDNFNNEKIGVIAMSGNVPEPILKNYPDKEFVVYPTLKACADALEREEIETAVVDKYSGQIIVNQIYNDHINIQTTENIATTKVIAIYENEPKELLAIINKSIDPWVINEAFALKTNTLIDAVEKYNLYDFWVSNRTTIFAFSIMLIVLVSGIAIIDSINTNRLEKKNNELENANAVKSDFMARMSHDMRTPMSAIIGLADFGLEEIENESASDYFSQIKNSSQYLLSLLNDILDMQKIESGEVELNPQFMDGDNFVKSVATIIEPQAEAKNIKFQVDFKKLELNKPLCCDIVRIQQIFVNLLNNAVKYTKPGGEVIWKIKYIENEDGEIFLTCEVSDNGIGMSEEFVEKMFEPFTQEINSLSGSEGGTGLGLSITKKLVDLMEGDISCESELGKGTKFKVAIPLIQMNEEQLAKCCAKIYGVRHGEVSLDGKHVLLCEDVPINVKIAVKLLESVGITADVAENGEIGVGMARSGKYDAILMDIRMPVKDGLTAAREIREFDMETPIIALSANAYSEDIQKSIDAGMDVHLSKPINKEILFDVLKDFLR